MYESSEITILNSMEAIAPTVAFLRVVAEQLGLNDRETNRICYALKESLSNAIRFDFEPGAREDIHISINAIASGIEVIIRDYGIPRDPFIQEPTSIEEIASATSFKALDRNNADVINAVSDFVLHKLLDRYHYANLGKAGRKVEMALYASNARVNMDTGKKKDPAGDDSLSCIRFAEHDDLTGIARLFYTSYGYSYINDAVYYPKRLAEQIAGGSLISAVAVSQKNRVIGHVALMEPFTGAKIVECGMAVSAPDFRGQGIMERLFEIILERARHLSFSGIFSHSVTNHVFTQKICRSYGFSEVALLVGYATSELSFKKIHRQLHQRESTIISFKPLRSRKYCPLFLPGHHREHILELYAGIGGKVGPAREGRPQEQPKKSMLSHTVSPVLNIAELVIESIGRDLEEQLAYMTRKLCIDRLDILYLLIDLQSPHAPEAVKHAEAAGYFFAGIFPGYHHPHSLVLQYLNNLAFDYDAIVTLTPLATRLKSYIQRHDPNQLSEHP